MVYRMCMNGKRIGGSMRYVILTNARGKGRSTERSRAAYAPRLSHS